MVLSKHDPMTQLTHVCKRIVIWLRTLYCWTRLLPAQPMIGGTSGSSCGTQQQHSQHIGFSIYVNTDYTVDDTSDLIQNQGFACHSSSSSRTGSGSGSSGNHNNGLVITTPYGELSWRVVYSPLSKLERILPHRSKSNAIVRIQPPPPRKSQPIPMTVAPHHMYPNSSSNNNNHPGSDFAPRSAPSTQHIPPHRTTSYTERSQQRMNDAAAATPYQRQLPMTGKSFDPHRHRQMLLHHNSDINVHQQHAQQNDSNLYQNHPSIIQRSQTTIGNPSSPIKIQKPIVGGTNADKQPERVMSGLSLALLMANNDDAEHNNGVVISKNQGGDADRNTQQSIFRSSTATNTQGDVATIKDRIATLQVHDDERNADESNIQGTSSSYQTRRAALHQMPPHLVQQQQMQSSIAPQRSTNDEGSTGMNNNAFGDYGYGYNNHIPWQKIHPSQSNPTMAQPHLFVHTNSFGARTTLSTSPTTTPMSPIQPHFVSSTNHNNSNSYSGRDISPMSGTYYLRSTPPTVGSMGGGGGVGHLIPPRTRSDGVHSRSVTPPFQPRPVGFILQPDPPTSMFLGPSMTAASRLQESSSDVAARKTSWKLTPSPPPPVTSLDSLRSSPFQQSQQLMTLQPQPPNQSDSRSAMFSSLAAAAVLPPPTPGGGDMDSDYLTAPMSLAPSLLLDATSSSSMRRSLWGQRSCTIGSSGVMPSSLAGLAGRNRHNYLFDAHGNDDYYSEEMPFAVEIPTSSIFDGSTASSQQQQIPSKSGAASKVVGASSTFGTASSLATLAQKCSMPNQRLRMFDRQNMTASSDNEHDRNPNSNMGDFTSSLADQLQEFRSFGASLQASSIVQQETSAHQNFGGGDDHNVLTGSATSSISLKS